MQPWHSYGLAGRPSTRDRIGPDGAILCAAACRFGDDAGTRLTIIAPASGACELGQAGRRWPGRRWAGFASAILGLALLLAPAAAKARSRGPAAIASPGRIGLASFYGARHQGRMTASGRRFNARALTAASHSLPFGMRVRVTALATGRSVVVTITDRMDAPRRLLDLSRRAAQDLGILRQGVAIVAIGPV
ncbi:MAG: septal ring lytic transglycosylase RlpA family protein [Acetobacteraceae bacterium]